MEKAIKKLKSKLNFINARIHQVKYSHLHDGPEKEHQLSKLMKQKNKIQADLNSLQ